MSLLLMQVLSTPLITSSGFIFHLGKCLSLAAVAMFAMLCNQQSLVGGYLPLSDGFI